jgi:benzoyl-CoA 2,3-dioxygenase component B
MSSVDLLDNIPNNVDLKSDKKLKRALDAWQPEYLKWWRETGPAEHQDRDVYLRTAISVDAEGWAQFGYTKMPDYRWGIFLSEEQPDRKVGFGDHLGQPAFKEVPGEYRNMLRRIIVNQADTEPASVEQQRYLCATAPSLLDMRNLFQVNVEEGRHLWAMVYLLQRYFGKDGREEADELLLRRAGDADKPRILNAFNNPCPDWLSFFSFTMFMDRDGKFQLAALAESGFDPLARTCRFMLTEEAHHLSVGETGLQRIVRRTAQLMNEHPGKDVREYGGIPLDIVQKSINYWYTYSLDLFGGEISSNAADYFASGLKGRFREEQREKEHTALEQSKTITEVTADGRLSDREVPLRTAMNECLRDGYVEDCERALRMWNKELEDAGIEQRLYLPHRRFHRHVGEYAKAHFDTSGEIIGESEFSKRRPSWFLDDRDVDFLATLMKPCREIGKIAGWIAPPVKGVGNKPFDFEYVKL